MPLSDISRSTPSLRVTLGQAAATGYAALALVDTALAASDSLEGRRMRRITKPLLMPMLGSAFSASLTRRGITRGGLLRGGTVAAQACSGVGDIALLGSSRPAFLGGLSAFLGAHVAYAVAFSSVRQGRSAVAPTLPPEGVVPQAPHVIPAGVAGAAAAFIALGPAMSLRAAELDPGLGPPVLAYTGAIATMVAAASSLDHRIPRRARRRIAVGAGLFLCSDTLLAARAFVLSTPARWVDATVMATYTAAQGLIAAGVSEAVRALDPAAAPDS